MDTIGIRELRQEASKVIDAAAKGRIYRVTNHGKDTGVTIGRPPFPDHADSESAGVAPRDIIDAGIYDQPHPAGYAEALLDMVEGGRDRAGRVGDR